MNLPEHIQRLSGYEPHISYEEHARRIRERLVAERLSKIVMKGETDGKITQLNPHS